MKKIKLLIILLIGIILVPINVFADTGPKPSIDVKIKNLKTDNYIIDLFVYDKEKANKSEGPSVFGHPGLTDDEIQQLYELNYDGWISITTRAGAIIFSDCKGNKEHINDFGYFGTPEVYKIVIINNDTGEIKISDKIVRKEFNSVVEVDYNNMKVVETNINIAKTLIIAAIVLVLTIVIELVIALLFKTKNYITIAITNLITNVSLQALLLLFTSNYLLVFIIGEVLVITAELIVYLLRLKDISKAKTIIYTLVANLVTILISFLLYKI
jgi:hypothetical protein